MNAVFTPTMPRKKFVVLMAEDNDQDIAAVQYIWERDAISHPLYIVHNGEECLDYLYQRGSYSVPGSAPFPSLLLLDINMPKMDGIETLKMIRSDRMLRLLPVVMFTALKTAEYLKLSFDAGANAYIVKPKSVHELGEAMSIICRYWQMTDLPDIGQFV